VDKAGKKDLLVDFYELTGSVVFAFSLFVLAYAFAFGGFSINQTSMTNTMQPGETVIISRLPYTPKHGDIVIFTQDTVSESMVKRVVGLPGDVIEYIGGTLYINGEAQDEPYLRDAVWNWAGDMDTRQTVPPGSVFVMGDNRNFSKDSRNTGIGFVDTRSILGRAVVRISPLSRFGFIY
jgi:signal peptidase I